MAVLNSSTVWSETVKECEFMELKYESLISAKIHSYCQDFENWRYLEF